MKKFRKILAVVIAMSMIMAMGMTAFAENGANKQHTITIKNNDEIGDHTYEAYQVFAGDYDAASGKLSNITWGTGVNGDAILDAVKADTETFGADAANAKDASDVAALLGQGNDTAKAKKFAAIVGANLGTTVAGTSTGGEGTYTISVKGDGYYFVKDKANSLPTDTDEEAPQEGDAETRYILQVVKDVEVAAKSNTVESEKKVQDINDSTDTGVGALADSADYDIGDTIPYTLTFTLPANYADYATYAVNFFDDMSAGLTYKNDAKIFYGEDDTTGATISFAADSTQTSAYTDPSAGTVYKASVADLKTAAPDLEAGDVIKITYTVTLNENAVVGADGNPNKYQVEYSNNPNGTGTGKTPWDMNIVFTYDIEVDKVTGTDSNETALQGAAFALYKLYTAEALELAGKGAVTEIKYDNGTKTYTIGSGEKWVLVEQKTAGTASEFTFSGVDDGTYLLVETTTPGGYNSILPSKFEVAAVHNDGDTPEFVSVTGTNITGDGLAPITLGTKTKSADDNTVTGLKTKIINKEGTTLPTTGGIGTTLFYIVGAILVIGAGVILISRRRMDAQ